MSGRHKVPRTKRAIRARAEQLAEDLSRSEATREALLEARDRLLGEVRDLAGKLYRLQVELGSEATTAPVPLVDQVRPVAVLRPPQTGLVPLQGPDGKRMAVQVGRPVSRPSPGLSAGHKPYWATG
jgi:hypothetical protein